MLGKPYKGDGKYIFVSYSHNNIDEVSALIEKLQDHGYNVWYDEGIDPGTEWDENIARHIKTCSYFIAYMTYDYLDSQNCKDELNYARDLNKERLLIYGENVELPDGMKMRLNRLQAIYKNKYRKEQDFYNKVFEAHGIERCRERGAAAAPASGGSTEESAGLHETAGGTAKSKRAMFAALVIACLLIGLAGGGLILHRSSAISAEEAAKHVYANRGTGGTYDDLDSMRSAYDQGAVYIEQDIVLSPSGKLYVSKWNLSDEELEEQNKILLRDVFDEFGKKIHYVVEIKTRTDECVDSFISLVREYGYEDTVIVQSFEGWVLKDIKEEFPEMKTILLVNNANGGREAVLDAMDEEYIDEIAVSVEDELMTNELCQMAHDNGKTYSAWVLNNEDAIRSAIEMGLDTYFTERPELAIWLEQKYR